MSVGCAMHTMNQPLACYFRCAWRTLHWIFELIRAPLSKSNHEISKIIAGIEILSEIGVFNPPDQFWPLLRKLVEKKVAHIIEINKHTHKQGLTP